MQHVQEKRKKSGSENPFMIKVENDGITKEQSAKITDVGNVQHQIRRDITTAQTEQSTVETAIKKRHDKKMYQHSTEFNLWKYVIISRR